MAIDPREVIAEARTWIGTPFHHQAQVKGHGADCVGLVLGAAEPFGWQPDPAQWRQFRNYARVPNPRKMLKALNLFMLPVTEEPQLGDVLYLEWKTDLPTHVAIVAELSGRLTLIHALSEVGYVVETSFVDPWPGRVNSVWRYPFVAKVERWPLLDSVLPAPR
jgi:NlpC/P60 family putative phage cell wall peptidase